MTVAGHVTLRQHNQHRRTVPFAPVPYAGALPYMLSSLRAGGELSLRGIVLGALITVVFTASNVYLGLKIGLTFASSIPAAVISMATLRLLGRSTVLENNMVQTQASAAGTLSCVFAALPALVMVGYWQGFPFLQTALISAAGGMTGVLFTIPLRRALVSESALPYPEGVACAEILKASSADSDSRSVRALAQGSLVAAVFSFLSGGLRLVSDGVSLSTSIAGAAFRIQGGYSLALVATGYLVGIGGGIAMLVGAAIAWGIAVPWLSLAGNPQHLAVDALATTIWVHKVRFMGAGTIAVAALWTLATLARPVARGLRDALSVRHAATRAATDRDLPPLLTIGLGAALIVILSMLFAAFLWPQAPHGAILGAVLFGALMVTLLGFLVASACGYMAGIIGSSSSPISGVGIIAIVVIATLMLGLETLHIVPPVFSAADQHLAIAFCLFLLSAIVASSAISNDNLQDLKTGQLVGASPWRQQIALLIGCAVGALVIPPVLNVLYQAYGFVGTMPRAGMDATHALAAPQPALMAAIATGILLHKLDWDMIGIGALLGCALIVIDMMLRRRGRVMPPLAVGMGIYLPPDVSITIGFGALVGWMLARRRPAETHSETGIGTMLASGFIVGESLMGVLLAALAGLSGHSDLLAIASGDSTAAVMGGGLLLILIVAWFGKCVLMR